MNSLFLGAFIGGSVSMKMWSSGSHLHCKPQLEVISAIVLGASPYLARGPWTGTSQGVARCEAICSHRKYLKIQCCQNRSIWSQFLICLRR